MVVLYSTGCPQCNVLKQKLDAKNVDYVLENDVDKMIEKGFTSAPILEVDGEIMNTQQAFKWLTEL